MIEVRFIAKCDRSLEDGVTCASYEASSFHELIEFTVSGGWDMTIDRCVCPRHVTARPTSMVANMLARMRSGTTA